MEIIKLFYKLIISRKWVILSFAIIFFIVMLPVNKVYRESYQASFNPKHENLTLGLVNLDGEDPVSQGLIAYMKTFAEIVELENDEERIIDSLYTMESHDVFIIPENYGARLLEESLKAGGNLPALEKVSGTYLETSAYVSQMLNKYLYNFQIRALAIEDGSDQGQIRDLIEDLSLVMEEELDLIEADKPGNIDTNLYGMAYSLMVNYIFMVIFINTFGIPALAMRDKTIVSRERLSSLSDGSRNSQFFIACTSFAGISWLIIMAIAFIIYGFEALTGQTGILLITASFLSTFAVSGLGFLIASLAPNMQVLGFFQVALGLVISFGSGIFIPRYLVGQTLQNLVSWAPPIWQVKANEIILSAESLNQGQVQSLKDYFLILVLLGLAYYAVSFVVMKYRTHGVD